MFKSNVDKMKQVITIGLIVLLYPFFGFSQCPPNAENVTLLYQYDDNSAATLYGHSYNDCWGYTDGSGNEFAILGGIDSIYVFDITTPASAFKVDADYVPQSSLWRDFKTYDHYLYAVSDQPGTTTGMLVYDLDSLSSGKLHLINAYNNVFNRAHNLFIEEANSKLYVVGSNTGAANEGVLIYDLSTDAYAQNPNLIKAVNFDTLVGNPSLSTYIHDIFVRNDTAYCSHGYTGYYIWDLSNPTSLDASAFVGSMDNSTSTMGGYVHSSWNTADNKYAIMAVEVNGSFPDKRQLFVVDQNNINAPVLETTWKEPLLACVGELNNVPHNAMIRSDTMFVSYYHDGIQILDFSDPTNPQRIGYYDTDTTNTSYPGYTGAWGIYPYFPSGTFIGSDMSNGLFVFKYEDFCPAPPEIDPISDVSACDFFTFPTISGNNLSGNQAYFDGPGGTGTMYSEGSSVFISGTFYAFDGIVGCSDEEVFELTINLSPSADAGNNASICNGDTTTITANGSGGNAPYSYFWSNGLGTGQSHDVFPSTNTNYSVTVSDANGCSAVDMVTIIVHQNPLVDAGSDVSICLGSSTTLSADGSGGNAPYTYFWDNGLGNGQSHEVSPEINTVYSVTITDANGCENTDAVTISINENPTVDAGADQVLCSGLTTTVSAEGTGGTAPYIYSWDNNLGDGQIQTVSPTTTTIYTVTISDSNGCTAEDQIEINVFPSPEANAGMDVSLCLGESTPINAEASGGLAPYTFDWDNGLGEGQSHEVSPNITTIYTVTVTDAIGCSSTDELTITVNDLPVAEIQGLNLLCAGQSQILDAGPGFPSYLWNTAETEQTIIVSSEGIYSVTVTDVNGCTDIDELELIVVDSLHPEIQGNLSFCSSESTTLNAGEGYGSYLWNTGEITQNIIIETPGIYSVTVTNAIGCEGSDNVVVIQNSAPTLLDLVDEQICFGGSTLLQASASGGTPPLVYFWDNGLGEGQSHEVSPAETTTYNVSVSDANGCMDTTQITIQVFDEILIETGPDFQICLGNSIELSAEASGGTAPYNFFWDNGLGEGQSHEVSPNETTTYNVIVTDVNGCEKSENINIEVLPELAPEIMGGPVLCENSSILLDAGAFYTSYLWSTGDTTQTIEILFEGLYSVTVSNAQSCEGSDEIMVIQNPAPNIIISPNQSICKGDSIEISVEAEGSAGDYLYFWDNGLGEGDSHSISPDTQTTYTVSITDINNCTFQANVSISVNENPEISTSEDANICFGETTTINSSATSGSEPYSFMWDQNLGEGASHEVSPDSNIIYTVIVTDQNECSSSDSVDIIVFPLPNLEISGELFLCNGVSTELNAGADFESYIWNTGDTTQTIEVTEGGSYSVMVRDTNNCEASAFVEITLVDSLDVNIDGSLIICEGDSTVLDAGSGYSSYTWSNGDTSQSIAVFEPGDYSVLVSNSSGCIGEALVMTVVTPKPEIIVVEDQTICEGEATIIEANAISGNGPVGFVWDHGLGLGNIHTVGPDSTTTYVVFGVDSNFCKTYGETTVFVNPQPSNDIVTSAPGELMAVQANAQYQWLDCDNNFAEIEGATDQTFNPTSSGNYAVEVQLENCIDTSECTQIIISGVNELTINQYHIYPVPTKDYVQISSTRSLVNMPYRLYSLEGQLVFSGILADDVRLSLQNYLPGMYLLELDGQVFKLVKM